MNRQTILNVSGQTILAIGLCALSAYGQTATATITGTVKDKTGAVIPGVDISVTNTATGFQRQTSTNESGDYTIPLLPPATYMIQAERQGFRKAVIPSTELLVNQVARVDIAIELGAVTQTIEVKGAVTPVLQTETTSLGQVIESREVKELPLNGRQFLQLAPLGPGVVPQAFATTTVDFCCRSIAFFFAGENSTTITANGQREESNMYLIDGTDNRNPVAGAVALTPSIEAIQEFKVQTNGFSPEFSFPTVVNIVTRSGGNQIHGDVFEFLRNDRLDARNFFDDKKPPFRQNQFGAVLGGPIILPNVYDGRDRTFLMANYEGRRIRKGNTFTGTFPTAAMRAGDFSGFPTIFDPATFDPLTGTAQPFPNNQIPPQRISQIYKNMLPFIPLPNVPGVGPTGLNFKSSPVDVRDFDQWTARLDHRISPKDTIFARYSLNNSRIGFPGVAPLYGTRFQYSARNLAIAETHTFGGAAVNQFHFGFQSTRNFRLADGNFGTINFAQDVIGLKNVSTNPSNFGLPNINVAGNASIAPNGFTPQGGLYKEFQFIDSLSILKGRHTFKLGGAVIRNRYDGIADLLPRGGINFNGFFTSNRKPTSARVAWADYVLGFPSTESVGQGDTRDFLRYNNYNVYLNDDFKATPNLTVNLGLRYQYHQPYKDEQNGLGIFDLEVRRVVLARNGEIRNGIIDPDFNDFGPRLGLAYRLNNKTVIRSAYGIFYDEFEFNDIQFIKDVPPNIIFRTISNPFVNPFNLDNQFPPVAGSQSQFAPFGMNRHNRDPYFQQWNFAIQRELLSNISVEIAYVGSKGTHMPGRFNPNQAFLDKDPLNPTPVGSRRPIPGVGDTFVNFFDRNSIYNSLQLRAEKRFSGGLSFLAAYTHGRAIDTASQSAAAPLDARNFARDRGLSDLNIADRATLSYTYQLPFGPDRRFLSSSGSVASRLIGGWQINGITTFSSGLPLTAGGGNSNTGGFTAQRPNAVAGCNPNLPRSQRTVNHYFNTTCFVRQQDGTFGTAGRNTIVGPGINNWDFSIFKEFKVNERSHIEFRAELFNVFNHPSFVDVSLGTSVDSPSSYGVITTARDGRDIQFGLKYIF
jgi:hypothetical protein